MKVVLTADSGFQTAQHRLNAAVETVYQGYRQSIEAAKGCFAISLVGTTFQCGPLVGIWLLAAVIPRPGTRTRRTA